MTALVAAARPGSRRPSLGLAAISLGFLMITLDATIVNVALGRIGGDLGGALAGAQWIVDGYTVAFAGLLLSAGALADRVGARTGFLAGLAVFTLGSVACAAAPSLAVLVGARVLQGAGAAALMPCSLALITHGYPDPHDRRRALGVWGGASGLGLASGPVLGGVLTATFGWRAIFAVNVPVAAVAALLVLRYVEETARHRRPLDVPGQVLAVAALTALTAAFVAAGERGWTAGVTWVLLAVGAGATAALVHVERTVGDPMVPAALFRDRTFTAVTAIGALFNLCLYGAIFCLAVDLRREHGLDALGTGLALLPLTVVTGLAAFVSGRVVARAGEWPVILGGLGAGVAGGLLLALGADPASSAGLALAGAPLGLTALAMPAMTAVAMKSASPRRVGLASGIFNASRQTGGALGIAVLGALLGTGSAVSLRGPGVAIAGAYAVGVALAGAVHRRDHTTTTRG